MKIRILKPKKGMALVGVVLCTIILTILGFSMLNLARIEVISTRKELNSKKAFYAAEAGIARLSVKLFSNNFEHIGVTALKEGTLFKIASFKVDTYYDQDPPYAISTGMAGNEQKSIKVELSFLARPYEEAIYAGNMSGQQYTLALRGQGVPGIVGTKEMGGRDIINGNIFADRAVALYEESSINPAPLPNPSGLNGDVSATETVTLHDSSSITGVITENAAPPGNPDLVGMNYQINNTHNVGQIFADQGVNSGYLPSGHELRDVMVKNPSNRPQECDSTSGDDYFLEPASVTGGGGEKDATTPLHLGDDRIYYIDGNVWVHSPSTYGMLVDGKVTIVATGNIHISDNIKYADDQSLLGLIALGKYDTGDQLVSGGNVYFGDPRFGTIFTVSGLMFAAKDFLYNTDSVTGGSAEPETGFSVYGNLAALNHVSVDRDWYTVDVTGEARPAYFDPSTSQWEDMNTGVELTAAEMGSIRHYQMEITYDDRARNIETQPKGLPKGSGVIFAGLTDWEELP